MGANRALKISFFVSAAAAVDVVISRNGRIVSSLQGSALDAAGWAHLQWNGRNGRRKRIAAGRYTIVAHAVGQDGQSVEASITISVRRHVKR